MTLARLCSVHRYIAFHNALVSSENVFGTGYDAAVDWTPVLIGLGGGLVGVAGGVVVTVMSNLNARALGRDAARRAAYVAMMVDTRDAERAIRNSFNGKVVVTSPDTITLLLKARADGLLGSAEVRRQYNFICEEFLSFPLIRDTDEYFERYQRVRDRMLVLEDRMASELSPTPSLARLWHRWGRGSRTPK